MRGGNSCLLHVLGTHPRCLSSGCKANNVHPSQVENQEEHSLYQSKALRTNKIKIQEKPHQILLMTQSQVWASLVAQLVKNLPAMWETWVLSLVGKIPCRRERLPAPLFWPGEFHGLYSPWGRRDSDKTARLSLLLRRFSRVRLCVTP